MKIGQMSLITLSSMADYVQLDICGCSLDEVLIKYNNYNCSLEHILMNYKKGDHALPVILHGDWGKKGCSENSIMNPLRVEEYISIMNRFKDINSILGVTIHPPYRRKIKFEDFMSIIKDIEFQTGVPVFVENRSNKKIWLSTPEEIIEFSNNHTMTIDIPQLYISCGYSEEKLIQTLKQLNMDNVIEVHLANVKRLGNGTYVGRRFNDGDLDMNKILPLIKDVQYVTLEILGGVLTFENHYDLIESWYESN